MSIMFVNFDANYGNKALKVLTQLPVVYSTPVSMHVPFTSVSLPHNFIDPLQQYNKVLHKVKKNIGTSTK